MIVFGCLAAGAGQAPERRNQVKVASCVIQDHDAYDASFGLGASRAHVARLAEMRHAFIERHDAHDAMTHGLLTENAQARKATNDHQVIGCVIASPRQVSE